MAGRRYHVLALTRKPIPLTSRLARQFDMGGVDLRRYNSGRAPVLLIHDQFDWEEVVGHIVAGSAKVTDRGLEIDVELLDADELPKGLQARLDAGIRSVSVGTKVLDMDRHELDMGILYVATEWEPEEISLVPVGADRDARLEDAA